MTAHLPPVQTEPASCDCRQGPWELPSPCDLVPLHCSFTQRIDLVYTTD